MVFDIILTVIWWELAEWFILVRLKKNTANHVKQEDF